MPNFRLLPALAITLVSLAACVPAGGPSSVAYQQPQWPDYPAMQASPGYAYQPAQQGPAQFCCITSREEVVQSYVPRRPVQQVRVGCPSRNPCPSAQQMRCLVRNPCPPPQATPEATFRGSVPVGQQTGLKGCLATHKPGEVYQCPNSSTGYCECR